MSVGFFLDNWKRGTMGDRKIQITEHDMSRLRALLRNARDPFGRDRPYLDVLGAELERAEIVSPTEISPDVITMNSTMRIRIRTSRSETTLSLVFPEDAVPAEDRISVMSPLGAALLGYRVGDSVSFRTPAGPRTCEILDVLYQPEAAGDLHL